MSTKDKKNPEVPAGETIFSLSHFSRKPAALPHSGEPHSKLSLRQKAEAHFREREEVSAEKLGSLSSESLQTILHELRVHQIELEMQNEELRRAQEDLETSRTRYFDLYDLAPVGYVTVGEAGLILEANLTAAQLIGTARPALANLPISRLIFREDQGVYYKHRQRLIETGEPQACELRLTRADGSTFWAQLLAAASQAADGSPALRVVLSDISDRKSKDAELQGLRTAVEQSANTIMITDAAGSIEYVNPAFEKSTGYSKAEVAGKNPRILSSSEHDEEFYRPLWETINVGKIWRGEFHNRRKDGSLFWESATISPVQSDSGEILRFIAIKEDITVRKRLERELADALRHAEEAAAAKSDFLGMMSHELRTPLSGVLGFTELLSDTPLDDDQKSFAKTISASGEHLLALVNDILDYSSIEHGSLTIQAEPFAIDSLLESSDAAIRQAAAEKGVTFRCEVAPGVPDHATGDVRRIRQILINLLGNALKFTEAGSVILRIAPGPGGQSLEFAIEDTGIGISPATLGGLFKPFTQANSTTSRSFGGTGLGLAISKRLAEAMGGAISVESTPGKGSTFTFRLPLEISAVPVPAGRLPADKNPEPLPTNTLVLVAEDDPNSSRLAGKMLESLGYRAAFAADGAEAVKAFAPGKFAAILMDMAMPVMDGLEATKNIRSAETGPRVLIIALTANVMPGDRERCLASGMDGFLAKPFKRAELGAMLAGKT